MILLINYIKVERDQNKNYSYTESDTMLKMAQLKISSIVNHSSEFKAHFEIHVGRESHALYFTRYYHYINVKRTEFTKRLFNNAIYNTQ